ncbi:class I SAM-dependent methyltransferase [Botrimarina sp.]|uniref:class I SAM-dependent methyltransferase n=1 Tax=Botrimarina sp. TaxID=2795802 RepID=UPI0032ECE922
MSPIEQHAPWLTGDAAAALLQELAGAEATVAAVAAMRKRLTDDAPADAPQAAGRAAALFELVELRSRAARKFTRAAGMYFTRKALAQATDEWVARYKARRFAGCSRVVDLCCGAGGDLIGLAGAATEAAGVDADPVLAAMAERNAAVYGFSARVSRQSLGADDPPDADAWHADPDRRPAGRRTSQPDRHEPPLEVLAAWRRSVGDMAVKFAPAARLPDEWLAETEAEWISRGGECRQLVVWAGRLASAPGRRRATRLFGGPNSPAAEPATLVGTAGLPTPTADRLGDWIVDPDPAVLAADLRGSLAERHGLAGALGGSAYLTGDRDPQDPLAPAFRVLEVLPLKPKLLSGWLAERGVGRLEIKCRGVDVRPESLRQKLRLRGSEELTLLVLSGGAGRPQVVAAERPGHN